MNEQIKDLIIIGAGPYGLSIGSLAKSNNLNYVIVGKPMEFWKNNMPIKMHLRSSHKWHMCPEEIDTLEVFLSEMGKKVKDSFPLPLELILKYSKWFLQRKGLNIIECYVNSVQCDSNGIYKITLEDDNRTKIKSKNIVAAPGFGPFQHIPEPFKIMFEQSGIPFEHSCNYVDFSNGKHKNFLIVGGRQAAFEWASIIGQEREDAQVYISYRHTTPSFEESDWSFMDDLSNLTLNNPGFFKKLKKEEQDLWNSKGFKEGRLKLEPWLKPHISKNSIKLFPQTKILSCNKLQQGFQVELIDVNHEKQFIVVDQVILATGYLVDVRRISWLKPFLQRVKIQEINGSVYPVLDCHFQSESQKGLFFTGPLSVGDFSFLFGFVKGITSSSFLIIDKIKSTLI